MKYIKKFEDKEYNIWFDFFSENFSNDIRRLTSTINFMKSKEIDFDIFYDSNRDINDRLFTLWCYPDTNEKEKILDNMNYATNKDVSIKNKYDVRLKPSLIKDTYISEEDFMAYVDSKKYNL